MKNFDIRFFTRAWFVGITALVLASCGGGSDDNESSNSTAALNNPQSTQAAIQELTNVFGATLTGIQEVPPRPSGATGSGTVVVNASTRLMTATLTTTDITGNAAHIHQAPPGVSGPIIFPLSETSPGSGIWTTTATLTEAQFNTLRTGEFYFNVHSTAFPDGEIRGQITAQLTGSSGTIGTIGTGTTGTGSTATGASTGTGLIQGVTSTSAFVTALRGQHVVPAVQTAAQGSGTVLINPATRQMIAAIVAVGMNGTEEHIHEGALGATGPIVIPLVQTGAASVVWFVRATLTEAQYNSLLAGNMYLDVHSAAFPGGEIRGQILSQKLPLPLVTGALGNAATPSTTTPGTGTPTAIGAIPTGISTGIGTGFGTGIIGTGTSSIGPTGTGSTGIGATGTGATGIGATGIGATGIGATGTIGTGIGTGTGSLIGTTPAGTLGTGIGTGIGIGTMTPLPGATTTGTGSAGLAF